jgi:hypothetical protein
MSLCSTEHFTLSLCMCLYLIVPYGAFSLFIWCNLKIFCKFCDVYLIICQNLSSVISTINYEPQMSWISNNICSWIMHEFTVCKHYMVVNRDPFRNSWTTTVIAVNMTYIVLAGEVSRSCWLLVVCSTCWWPGRWLVSVKADVIDSNTAYYLVCVFKLNSRIPLNWVAVYGRFVAG